LEGDGSTGRNRRMEGDKLKMKSEEGKKEVMQKKRALRGRRERIEDDWTRKERMVQWRLEEIARGERRRNRRAMVRYARIWIEGVWWKWEEDKGELRDGRGRKWKSEEGEERGETKWKKRERK